MGGMASHEQPKGLASPAASNEEGTRVSSQRHISAVFQFGCWAAQNYTAGRVTGGTAAAVEAAEEDR